MNMLPSIIALVPTGTGSPNIIDPMSLASALAQEHGMASAAIVAGPAAFEQAKSAARADVDVTWVVDHQSPGENESPEVLADLFAEALNASDVVGEGAKLILLPYGSVEEEVAARLARKLGGTALGKCLSVQLGEAGCTIERPAYGGRATARVTATRPPYVCLVRPGVAAASLEDATAREVRTFVPDPPSVDRPQLQRIPHEGPRQAPLEGARIIVSGGRGMGSAENFGVLEEIATALGGVVGCSLPVADSGWRPISRQIGQSGKFVSPDIYLAVGISGMSQHLAGIGGSTRIIAINMDPDAAIWSVAEYGALGDWNTILPPLLQQLQQPPI